MSVAASDLDRSVWCYRMKDLVQASGLERQAIHFYIQQGLLPPGRKTGRNMAYYREAHVERLRTIQKLQHERFLPLKAIKALLDDTLEEGEFPEEQQRFLARVKARLDTSLVHPSDERASTSLADLVTRGISEEDVREALALGLLSGDPAGAERPAAEVSIAERDIWLVELLSQLREVGFTRERGFTVADVGFYEEFVSRLFQQEIRMIRERLSALPPEEVAQMIARALPIIDTFLSRYHSRRVSEFFGALEEETE